MSYISSDLSKPSAVTAPQYMSSSSSLTSYIQSSNDNVTGENKVISSSGGISKKEAKKPQYNISLSSVSSNNQSKDNVATSEKKEEQTASSSIPKQPRGYDGSTSSLSSQNSVNKSKSSFQMKPKRAITPVQDMSESSSAKPIQEETSSTTPPKKKNITPPRVRELSPKRAPAWGSVAKVSPRSNSKNNLDFPTTKEHQESVTTKEEIQTCVELSDNSEEKKKIVPMYQLKKKNNEPRQDKLNKNSINIEKKKIEKKEEDIPPPAQPKVLISTFQTKTQQSFKAEPRDNKSNDEVLKPDHNEVTREVSSSINKKVNKESRIELFKDLDSESPIK